MGHFSCDPFRWQVVHLNGVPLLPATCRAYRGGDPRSCLALQKEGKQLGLEHSMHCNGPPGPPQGTPEGNFFQALWLPPPRHIYLAVPLSDAVEGN